MADSNSGNPGDPSPEGTPPPFNPFATGASPRAGSQGTPPVVNQPGAGQPGGGQPAGQGQPFVQRVSGGGPQQSPYSPQGAPPPSSSGCKIVLLIVGLVVGIPVLCCGGCLGMIMIFAEPNPARELARDAIKADQTCRARLGTPMSAGISIYSEHDEEAGTAYSDFDMEGSRETALVYCEAKKQGDDWVLTHCEIEYDDGEVYYLIDGGGIPPELRGDAEEYEGTLQESLDKNEDTSK